MTIDLGLWLDAAAGSDVPPDCYAAVRQGEAKGPVPPTYCVPHKVSCLGHVGRGGGPVVVDVFQRVGSITVSSLQAGEQVEATVDWPGRSEVRLRITVFATGQGTEVPVLAQLPHPAPIVEKSLDGPDTGCLLAEAQIEEPEPLPEALAEAPLLQDSGAGDGGKGELPAQISCTSPVLLRAPVAEKTQEKIYKPISLNNCNQIIPHLYLGGVQAVADTQSLVQQGIRAVCCCCRELEFPTSDFCRELQYYRVDVEDMAKEPIELFFPEATEFIHSWISREQPVLVHCRAGVSRSASVVIAYLIAYQGYSLYEAFFLVRSHRSVVTPNLGFMEKLADFEEAERKTEPTIEINKYESWYTSPERAAVPDLKPD
eukprot:CAMPEP_0179077362 /NCGR_PEP_ID=MMETSP0796-20121207/34576_1 /TAXON_ID=73915 /ORGANISM="Pyrodinium bahamense, Strain pbaha01" /LENGTH=370 /DNA_ID=CAMNT_0020774641 /DNA_START=10 /DNA_END=1122 /DNA_ORIENTATION=-